MLRMLSVQAPIIALSMIACSQGSEWVAGSAAIGQKASGPAPADVAAEVSAAINAHWTAIRNGDTVALKNHHTGDLTFFGAESDELIMLATVPPTTAAAALWEKFAGATMRWTPRDIQVQAYGDIAVATFINEGSITWADGTVERGPRKVTEVWVRQPDGSWREAHHHDSRTSTPPR